MDRKLSENIATSIILSMFQDESGWTAGRDGDGDFVSDGVIRVSVDTREVLCRDSNSQKWELLDIETDDIERIQDVAYDMVNDRTWQESKAKITGVAIRHLGLSS